MNRAIPHITVCLCTYQRPTLLHRLMIDLSRQETGGHFTFSISVADNDPNESARAVIQEFVKESSCTVIYQTEPRRSISHARNKSIEPADGEYIAFIDDDEFPTSNWLLTMFNARAEHQAEGVLGPVRAYFDQHAPDWVRKGGFYDRPEHQSGFILPWTECRTGNALLKRVIVQNVHPIFNPEFGTGGSDVDFFRRMIAAGHKFVWCNEAVVYEHVPPSRWDRGKLLRRALLRGKNAARHEENRSFESLAKSAAAIVLYAMALPFLHLIGHHLFMKYLVKWCDHTGKLLAIVKLNPVQERTM